MPLRALRSGILSTLLTLYDHPRTPSTPAANPLSPTTAAASPLTPSAAPSRPPSVSSLTSTAVPSATLALHSPAAPAAIFGPLIASTGNIAGAAAPR
ncbi:hypothetical protein EW146_g4721 [Bondarzewia mesenterica]|uniref:Uncharacterized protein n=1 Tax=Bondarzewia mesenterica TaxID=1095465 RepID=A0A4S4LTP9_9AGAM|nr:hypothetical protein EW146_g4721 [Bondarzewia mesenterica]